MKYVNTIESARSWLPFIAVRAISAVTTDLLHASRRLNTIGHWLLCANMLLRARENRRCPATLSNNNDPSLTEIASGRTNRANEEKKAEKFQGRPFEWNFRLSPVSRLFYCRCKIASSIYLNASAQVAKGVARRTVNGNDNWNSRISF